MKRLEYFNKKDWDHLHDAVLEVTGEDKSREDLIKSFNLLPSSLKNDAYKFGMNDKIFKDNMIKYLKNNY
jgi:hypothetical protein